MLTAARGRALGPARKLAGGQWRSQLTPAGGLLSSGTPGESLTPHLALHLGPNLQVLGPQPTAQTHPGARLCLEPRLPQPHRAPCPHREGLRKGG